MSMKEKKKEKKKSRQKPTKKTIGHQKFLSSEHDHITQILGIHMLYGGQ